MLVLSTYAVSALIQSSSGSSSSITGSLNTSNYGNDWALHETTASVYAE